MVRANSRPRLTNKKRPNQRASRKLNDTCISRMYVTEYLDGKVEVKFISAHSDHDLGAAELLHLPLPKGVMEEIAIKLSLGIPPECMMEGIHRKREGVGLSHAAFEWARNAGLCQPIH